MGFAWVAASADFGVVTVARLIDLSTLGIGERNPNAFNDPERAHGWNDLLKILEAAPAVDAVEVVRCKDCKHWLKDVAGCTDFVGRCELANYMVGAVGYCVYGERKDGDK